MSLNLGILLALACAVATQLGFLYKHKGANQAPSVDIRHPLRSAKQLYACKWFAIGMAVATGAWFFHVAALAFAPLSVVQAVLSTGVVILAVLAERIFGKHIGAPDHHHGAMLGAAAGVLFGVSDVAIKALTGAGGPVGVLTSPWLAVTVFASIVAFYASARGLQDGEAVPVIAATSTASNVSCILGGIIVFGDPMPGNAVGICVQAFAFILVVAAALVTPPPVQAASAQAHA